MAITLSFCITFFLIFSRGTMSSSFGSEITNPSSGFAFDLYQHVIKGKEQQNVVLSPLSIYTALGLAYMGAGGRTKEEMASVLRISTNATESKESFRRLLCKYKASSMLSIANKVYVQSGKNLQPSFVEASEKVFSSEADVINFSQSDVAAKTINSWVESKTNNKIQNLIDPSNLDSNTMMVLVNAIYFKGFWKNQFRKELTKKADFWTSETESVKVDMMSNNKAHYPYGVFEDLDAAAVELPFRDEDLAMLIILPNSKTGLPSLEAKLRSMDLFKLRQRMHSEEVIVSMPKFKIEFSIELNDVLSEMGMSSMFSDNADFSGLLNSAEPLKVSKVIHKAFIDVNEEGAEAAAATAGHVIRKRCIQFTREFIADHAFIIALIATSNEDPSVAFLGCLKSYQPNKLHDEL
ncbi:antichymotrypsin-2-like isoform X4 [Hermetia illucens]|uniref:antichymotrypsin-2-like isoform X4 n=1 Tax=Hermetia illucens TaxID=343691 RepID=UPI0018CBF749|nr:antichymotrypsin-2-like isoform X4 [Hermetia illucens]